MNIPANNRTTEDGTCGPDREPVTTWEAFDTLPGFHHETDPTYQLLRNAGYHPVSIANYRVRHLRTESDDTGTANAVDGELLSLCERCCTGTDGPKEGIREGSSPRVVDTQVWVAYFRNQRGESFVHVDGSGYDQETVARHFGGDCCGN